MGRWRLVAVAALALSVLVVPTAARAVVEPDPNGWTIKQLHVPLTAAVYVPQRDVFVGTVGPFEPAVGNDLVEISPATGAVGRRVYVGSTPDVVAVSDDGLVAYVGLLDTNKIVQVDLLTFTVVRTFTTYINETNAYAGFARDIAVVPGRNDTIVVALQMLNLSPSEDGVMAFRNGVALPNSVDSGEIEEIEMLDSSTVFGEGPHATSDLLHVDDDGVTLTRFTDDYLKGRVWYGRLKIAGSNIVTVSGHAVDPQTETIVQTYGDGHNNLGAFGTDVADNRVVYLDDMQTGVAGMRRFIEYNLATGAEIARHEFRDVSDPTDLVLSRTNALVLNDAAYNESFPVAYLAGPSVVAGDVPAGPATPSIVDGFSARVLPYRAAHLLQDTLRPLLYATTYSGPKADSLLAIDPVTGLVVRELALPGFPWAMAESGDGSTLYVTLKNTGDVVRVDLLTFEEVGRFNLGFTDYPGEIMWGHDIEVRPGTDNEVVIAQAGSGSPIHKGVALFVDGDRRPNVTPVHTGPDDIEFLNASTLYGSGYVMHVDEDGVTRTQQSNLSTGDFELDLQGRMLSQWGWVYDPVADQLVGAYGTPNNSNTPGGVEEAVLADRLYALGQNLWGDVELQEYELGTFRRIGARAFPDLSGWGGDLVTTTLGFASPIDQGLLLLTRPTCEGLFATVAGAGTFTGTPADDVIVGSATNDVIDGLGGNDVICGGAGNDILRSGLGNDILDGGLGKDYLLGGPGSQLLRGRAGEDILRGYGGNDQLNGGAGSDRLFGGGGSDVLYGGADADFCGVVERIDAASLCEATAT